MELTDKGCENFEKIFSVVGFYINLLKENDLKEYFEV